MKLRESTFTSCTPRLRPGHLLTFPCHFPDYLHHLEIVYRAPLVFSLSYIVQIFQPKPPHLSFIDNSIINLPGLLVGLESIPGSTYSKQPHKMTMKHFDQELLNRVSALESKFAEVQSIQSTEFDVPSFQSTQAVTESHPSDLVEEQTVADQVDTLAGNIGKVLTLDDLFSAKDVFSPEALCTIDST